MSSSFLKVTNIFENTSRGQKQHPNVVKRSKRKKCPIPGQISGAFENEGDSFPKGGGSVADDLDVGAIIEGEFMHIAPHRDAHFGEVGATLESPTKDTPFYLLH